MAQLLIASGSRPNISSTWRFHSAKTMTVPVRHCQTRETYGKGFDRTHNTHCLADLGLFFHLGRLVSGGGPAGHRLAARIVFDGLPSGPGAFLLPDWTSDRPVCALRMDLPRARAGA